MKRQVPGAGKKVGVTLRHTRHSAYFGGISRPALIGFADRTGCPWQWFAASSELAVPLWASGDVEARMVAAGHGVQLQMVATP